MFWRKEDRDLKVFAEAQAARANQLDAGLQQTQNENTALRNQLQKLREEVEAREHSCTFAFDFKAVNAFSIERNVREGRPVTIIGYLLPEETVKDGVIVNTDTVREWYLYCSAEQHEQLVKQFNEARK